MARNRSPNREKAKEMYLESKGNIKLIDIAINLGLKDSQIRKWKSQDKWELELKGALPKNKSNATKKVGAPKGNKNAVGNDGGAPVKNKNAETHGFFSKYLPEETLELMKEIEQKDKLDILWENITIQYAAIIRAQRIMHVESKDEMIKEIKKEEHSSFEGGFTEKTEWEFQFAWDRQATFLNAQSRAMGELRSMIKQYDELVNSGLANEEQKLRIEKLKVDIAKVKDTDNNKPIEIVIKRKGEGK